MDPLFIGCHNQDTERFPAELLRVQALRMCGYIRAHLSPNAGLGDICSRDRHRATVDLYHKTAAGAVWKHKTKDKVGNHADLQQRLFVRYADSKREWISVVAHVLGCACDKLGAKASRAVGTAPDTGQKRVRHDFDARSRCSIEMLRNALARNSNSAPQSILGAKRSIRCA